MGRRGKSRGKSGPPSGGSPRSRDIWLWVGAGAVSVVVAAVVVAVILAVMPQGLTGGEGESSAGGGPVGMAPDFSFTLYQGEAELGTAEAEFSQLQGRPVVLNFWAGLCPPCRAEMPDLQEFHEASKDQVTLIGIDIGQFTGLGNKDDARSLLEDLQVTYPAGFTDDGSVTTDYQVLGMPSTYFISSNGEVFEKWTGALNLETLTRITRDMLEAEGTTPSF